MTIKEAIRILEESRRYPMSVSIVQVATAKKLGIEALKAWKEFREDGWLPGHEQLPGETKED